MEKVVKIEFTEQSKAVCAKVSVQIMGEDLDSNKILEEAQMLFEAASSYSNTKTLRKLM